MQAATVLLFIWLILVYNNNDDMRGAVPYADRSAGRDV